MRLSTCDSTSKDMLGDPFEGSCCTPRCRDLRRVPVVADLLEKRAHVEVLWKRSIQLHQQRLHFPATQGALHSTDYVVLETVDVDFHEIRLRDLPRFDQ